MRYLLVLIALGLLVILVSQQIPDGKPKSVRKSSHGDHQPPLTFVSEKEESVVPDVVNTESVQVKNEKRIRGILSSHPKLLEQEVMKSYPRLGRIHVLTNKKVLLQGHEKSELDDLLSDHELLENYTNTLSAGFDAKLGFEQVQLSRFMMINYLTEKMDRSSDSYVKNQIIDLI